MVFGWRRNQTVDAVVAHSPLLLNASEAHAKLLPSFRSGPSSMSFSARSLLALSSPFTSTDAGCVICAQYFVPVTLIVGSYQQWNSGKCDISLALAKP
jgi:hypothetical protein